MSLAASLPPPSPTGLACACLFVGVTGEGGYFCIKIPDLLVIDSRNGSESLLALGEARVGSCSDYAETHLVLKHSADGGATWSALTTLYRVNYSVVGNAAPVQLPKSHPSHPLRVLVPFTVNNTFAWILRSDDLGRTWSAAENITTTASLPGWKWIGFGPPGSIVLRNSANHGRIVVPAYHSPAHNLDGTFTHPHTVLSDDGGDSWRLGWVASNTTDPYFGNECQAAEDPANGRIILSMRTLLFTRAQCFSADGGLTFSVPELVPSMPQPLDGVEGSIVYDDARSALYQTNLQEASVIGQRYNLTLHASHDFGESWTAIEVLDSNPSAYSSMQLLRNGSTAVLYERSTNTSIIFVPDQIVFGMALL
jgi:sialidase-1